MSVENRPHLLSGKLFLVLIALNVAIYLVQVFSGVHWLEPKVLDLLDWGGNAAPYTFNGEWWRLFTSMFLHGGAIHLALNMYMLLLCGSLAERAFGSVKFVVLYLLSGLFGSVVSALWHGSHKTGGSTFPFRDDHLQFIVSVGASGALMGLAAGYVAYRFVHGPEVVDGKEVNSHHAILQTIALNIGMGFMVAGVDQACHLGGLLAGAGFGFILALTPAKESLNRWFVMPAAATIIGGLILWGILSDEPSAELQDLHAAVVAEISSVKQQAVQTAQAAAAQAEQDAALAPLRREVERLMAQDAAAIASVDAATAMGARIELNLSPTAMTFNREGNLAFISGMEENAVAVIDLNTQTVKQTIRGGEFKYRKIADEYCVANTCLGRGAAGMLLSADEKTLFVASMRENAVAVVDIASSKVVASMPVGKSPRHMVRSADGTRGYVISADNSVTSLDLVKRLAIGAPRQLSGGDADSVQLRRPLGLWLAPDDKQYYAVGAVSNGIDVVDVDPAGISKEVPFTATFPYAEHFQAGAHSGDKKLLAIRVGDQITTYAVPAWELQPTYSLCRPSSVYSFALNNAGTLLAIQSSELNSVLLVRMFTGKIIGAYPINGWASALAFSADDARLYAALSNGYALSIIDIAKSINVNEFVSQHGEALCGATQ